MSGKTAPSKSGEVIDSTTFKEEATGYDWAASQLQAESDTHLEDDQGHGASVIIRKFEFSANPETFRNHPPTYQQLFNAHLPGIEAFLWKDGLKPFDGVEPKLTFNKKKTRYRIWVAATPSRAILRETPKTLSQILHER